MARSGLVCLALVAVLAFGVDYAAAGFYQTAPGTPRPPVARPPPPVYPNFITALSKTPNTNYGRQIVEGLKLQTTLSNPKLALTIFMPEDKYFDALAAKLKVQPTAMSKNYGLMKQVLYYHFVTGTGGVRKVFTTSGLKPGMKLDTMYISTTTKKPYQLLVSAVNGKLQIKSVGTSAYIIKPNIRCGAGVAHIINNVLVPMSLSSIPKF